MSERDTNYRGLYREDGMPWDGDFEYYCEPDDLSYVNISQDLDGKWEAKLIYLGGHNNCVMTVAEEMELRRMFPDEQERYQYIWDNFRRKDIVNLGYIEDPVYETTAERKVFQDRARRLKEKVNGTD